MAFSDNKITSADLTGKGVTGMADTPNLTTAQMQQKLDEIAKEVIPPKFNALCDDLDATDFSSIITSKSTDKMLFQRLNEYDQIEYSVDNVNWYLIASGKEVLDPTLEADNAKKLGGQLPAYYQKTTDNALNTTSKLTTGAINEINTALGNVDTTANEAPPYSASSTYAVGDYVSYQKHIYKCNTAILTAEAWNASHWTQTTLGEEIETVNNSLVVNGTTFYFDIQNGVKGMNTNPNRGADTFTPFNNLKIQRGTFSSINGTKKINTSFRPQAVLAWTNSTTYFIGNCANSWKNSLGNMVFSNAWGNHNIFGATSYENDGFNFSFDSAVTWTYIAFSNSDDFPQSASIA